jgi:hypothetical protein
MHKFEFIKAQFLVVAQGGVGAIHLANGVAL